ncbi:hypothetical protein EDB85DRAFT_980016 [Lactarius pseudohatsudake]|nr:hypothetical protein EDB85DRAFT_980016 [Lactarius pseudohatsudake]
MGSNGSGRRPRPVLGLTSRQFGVALSGAGVQGLVVAASATAEPRRRRPPRMVPPREKKDGRSRKRRKRMLLRGTLYSHLGRASCLPRRSFNARRSCRPHRVSLSKRHQIPALPHSPGTAPESAAGAEAEMGTEVLPRRRRDIVVCPYCLTKTLIHDRHSLLMSWANTGSYADRSISTLEPGSGRTSGFGIQVDWAHGTGPCGPVPSVCRAKNINTVIQTGLRMRSPTVFGVVWDSLHMWSPPILASDVLGG